MTDNWIRKNTPLLQKSRSNVDISVIGKEIQKERWAFKVASGDASPFVPDTPTQAQSTLVVDKVARQRRQSAIADIGRKQKPPLPPSATTRRTSLLGGEKIRPSLKSEIKRFWAERASFSLFSRSSSTTNISTKEEKEEESDTNGEYLEELDDPMMGGFFVVDRTLLNQRRKSTSIFSRF